MQNLYTSTRGALTGNSSLNLHLDMEFHGEEPSCPHCIPTQEGFVLPAVLSAPADDGTMALVCLHCALELAGKADLDRLPAHSILGKRSK